MTPDDDLLQRVHQEAGRRLRRRHRLVMSATAAVVILGISAAAAAGIGSHDDGTKVITSSPETTTTTEAAPTTTEAEATTSTAPTTTSTTTTTAPPTTTTAPPTTTTPPTTAPPGPTVITQVGRSGDLVATATATVDPARPGFVTVTLRLQDPYGSQPWGAVEWEPGSVGEAFGDSAWVDSYPTSCDDLIDDDPTTNLEPDRAAAPLDRTFTVTHDYGRTTGDAVLTVTAITSFCTTDNNQTRIDVTVPLGG